MTAIRSIDDDIRSITGLNNGERGLKVILGCPAPAGSPQQEAQRLYQAAVTEALRSPDAPVSAARLHAIRARLTEAENLLATSSAALAQARNARADALRGTDKLAGILAELDDLDRQQADATRRVENARQMRDDLARQLQAGETELKTWAARQASATLKAQVAQQLQEARERLQESIPEGVVAAWLQARALEQAVSQVVPHG